MLQLFSPVERLCESGEKHNQQDERKYSEIIVFWPHPLPFSNYQDSIIQYYIDKPLAWRMTASIFIYFYLGIIIAKALLKIVS